MELVKRPALPPIAMLCALAAGLPAAGPPPPVYSAVEVDRFVPRPGMAFPADYQNALADDTAREISLAFPTVLIVRQGQPAPYGHALLRISGVVSRFKPGGGAKRLWLGLGAGTAFLEAQICFIDGSTGQVLFNRQFKGILRIIPGGDSQTADSVARKIAKLCNTSHLVESN